MKRRTTRITKETRVDRLTALQCIHGAEKIGHHARRNRPAHSRRRARAIDDSPRAARKIDREKIDINLSASSRHKLRFTFCRAARPLKMLLRRSNRVRSHIDFSLWPGFSSKSRSATAFVWPRNRTRLFINLERAEPFRWINNFSRVTLFASRKKIFTRSTSLSPIRSKEISRTSRGAT